MQFPWTSIREGIIYLFITQSRGQGPRDLSTCDLADTGINPIRLHLDRLEIQDEITRPKKPLAGIEDRMECVLTRLFQFKVSIKNG
jgi:hypothetical protein